MLKATVLPASDSDETQVERVIIFDSETMTGYTLFIDGDYVDIYQNNSHRGGIGIGLLVNGVMVPRNNPAKFSEQG